MTEQMLVPPQASDVYEQMRMMLTSHYVSQMLRAAADLSLAEHLATADLTAAQVAEREGSAVHTTFRLMRACVTIGLLTADADGRFASTPLLPTLGKDTPGSLRGHTIHPQHPCCEPTQQHTGAARNPRSPHPPTRTIKAYCCSGAETAHGLHLSLSRPSL